MSEPTKPATAGETPALAVVGSESAGFIYFDGVSNLGTHNGIAQIEICANALIPEGSSTKVTVVCTAHLRCTLGGLAALKDAIQKIETMLTPPDSKPN